MKKTWILGTATVLFAFLAIIAISNNKQHYQTVIDEAKIVYYESAEDVVDDSALIVCVKKIDETPVSYPLENNLTDCFTISTVAVEKVYQNLDNASILEGNEIQILESQWVDEQSKIVHHTGGYLKMETGKQYFLLLGYNKSVNNYYPLGLLYGKIPIDPKEPLFLDDGYDQVVQTIEGLKQMWNIE